MDNLNRSTSGASQRSEEEMAWDTEFADMEEPRRGGVIGMAEGMAETLIKLPAALIQLPMAILPEETRRHARAAVLESFLAVRSLFSAMGDGVERVLGQPVEPKSAVRDPEGTWGNRRYGASKGSQGRAQRIQIQDEVSESGGGDGSGTRITIDDLGDAGDENDGDKEGRGLRADIDY
jgi:hypothetical protein